MEERREAKIEVLQLQAKESQGLPATAEARKKTKEDFAQGLRRSIALLTL